MSTSPVSRRRGRPLGGRTRLPVSLATLGVEPLTVRVDQAAAMVGCGLSKMKMLIASGVVESVRVGSMRLVRVSSLKRLVGETI